MRPKKSLGQNFLIDTNILSNIVNYGDIKSNDTILEIGPGTGNLTKKILERSPENLILIEKDKELAETLNKKFGSRVKIINDDILNCSNNLKFSKPIKVFGNLPYNISSQILVNFIKMENLNKNYEKFIFMFQKEMADRILAKNNTKHYGRLSILTSWRMNNEKIFDINPKSFYPKPKVWSSLVIFSPKDNYERLNKVKNLEHITNIFFNQRRKMIKKPMKQLFSEYEKVANVLKIDLNLRPQNLSKDKYIEICKIYEKLIQ